MRKLIHRIGRIGRIGKIGLTTRPPARIEPPQIAGPRRAELMPPKLYDMVRMIGYRRARRCWRLVKQGIQATLPEYCTYDWLESRPWLEFDFQTSLMGGRWELGGAVADFIIAGLNPEGLYVWRVQGDYWHSGREKMMQDEEQRLRLLQYTFRGVPIVAVVDLWETDIYQRYPLVFEMAEYGVGLRG